MTSLILLAAHQPTHFSNTLAKLLNLPHLYILPVTGYLGLTDNLTGLTIPALMLAQMQDVT